MDQVEPVLIDPEILGIVNNEFEIRRDQCRLSRAKVDASHLAIRVRIGYAGSQRLKSNNELSDLAYRSRQPKFQYRYPHRDNDAGSQSARRTIGCRNRGKRGGAAGPIDLLRASGHQRDLCISGGFG